MVKTVVPARLSGIADGLDFIEETLKEYKFKPKFIREAMLLSEETMVRLIDNASAVGTIHIHIKKKRGLATITLSAPGPDMTAMPLGDLGVSEDDIGRENESAIRGILLKAYEDKTRYARKGKYNFFTVTVGMPEKVFAIRTLAALAIALVTGFILQLTLNDAAKLALDRCFLMPIDEIFVHLLMLVAAPTVFFSIAVSVASYSSFSDPGRVSVKTFIGYAVTSIAAIGVGIGMFKVFKPGVNGLLSKIVSDNVINNVGAKNNLIQTIIDIVPSNIVDPFQNVDTLQLIFLALIFGVALGRIGDYSAALRNMIEALNTIFTKTVSMIMNVIPIVAFASTISLMLNIGRGIVVSIFEMLGVVLIGVATMMLIYCLLVLIVGRVSPFTFIKKYAPMMKETFILGSGLAALPKTMRCCKNSLGISPKVYSFSIPFGASFNMDGNCIYLTIAGLFIARLCGVQFSSSQIVPLFFTVLILSIGAPITPGTTIVCLTIILNQLGISLTAVSVLFGINAVVEMFLGMSNTAGDVAVSLAIARTEKLLNTEVFNSKPRIKNKKRELV